MTFDVIVIGSGFGGAISACRLQETGYRVLVLERGRRWDRSNFPRKPDDAWLWKAEQPEHDNGWLELRKFPNMTVAAGAAVGGGSLIYANISCEAPPACFERGWPKQITHEELKPYYQIVKQFMNVQEVPDNQWTPKMKLMQEAAGKAGMPGKFRKLELAVTFDQEWTYEKDFSKGERATKLHTNAQGAEQGTCVHLGNCDIGCDVHAKNTLDRNYLFWAEKKGTEVRPLHLVSNIEPIPGGYKVSYDQLEGGRRLPGSERARLVIVAGGSLGSTELLLHCKHVSKSLPNVSDFLGKNWSSNGDFLTPALYPRADIHPARGPTIGAAIDLYEKGVEGGFWIEDGGFPNLLAGLTGVLRDDPRTSFKAKRVIDFIQLTLRENAAFDNVMPWFAQGVDAANGTLSLQQRSWLDQRLRLHLEWDIDRSRKVIDAIVAMHKKLSQLTGGLPIVPPTWTLFKDLITPHPLGGCNMGESPESGVVDHRGEVFGHPGLYVADGAIIPEALGVNPSRTIGALAERIAAIIATEGK
jgi:cholesterol oxidase